MAYLVTDSYGDEYICEQRPCRNHHTWFCIDIVRLPKGTIKKLINKQLTWNDDPYEIF